MSLKMVQQIFPQYKLIPTKVTIVILVFEVLVEMLFQLLLDHKPARTKTTVLNLSKRVFILLRLFHSIISFSLAPKLTYGVVSKAWLWKFQMVRHLS